MSDGSIEVVSGTTRRKQTISDSDQSSPQIVSADFGHAFAAYQRETSLRPLLLNGDALAVLKSLPNECIDFAMTSPPYWGKREYENGGIGP